MHLIMRSRSKGSNYGIRTVSEEFKSKRNKFLWNLESFHTEAKHVGIHAVKCLGNILLKHKQGLVVGGGIFKEHIHKGDGRIAVTTGQSCEVSSLKDLEFSEDGRKSFIHDSSHNFPGSIQ